MERCEIGEEVIHKIVNNKSVDISVVSCVNNWRPWTDSLVDLVEFVEGELLQLDKVCLAIGQAHVS